MQTTRQKSKPRRLGRLDHRVTALEVGMADLWCQIDEVRNETIADLIDQGRNEEADELIADWAKGQP